MTDNFIKLKDSSLEDHSGLIYPENGHYKTNFSIWKRSFRRKA